ncbi:MAG: Ig-like domain-containing protein, partial [Gammaproteobacteria bacterium]
EAIPVGDPRITISGNTVTIDPNAVFSAGTGFFLNITAGALTDGAGNAYAGISGNTAFNFTTSGSSADTLAPTLLERSPADNATGVPVDAAIVLGFSESVVRGSGDITLRAADGSLLESIPVSDTTRVRIDGATVTIDPNANFAPGTSYSLNIASGAFRDGAGNAFAGISGTTAYDFRTAGSAGDTTAPTLSSRSPADGASGVAVSAVFTLSFSEAMRAGSGEIEIRSSTDGSVVQSIPVSDTRQVLIDGNVVTIDPSIDLPAGGDFFLSIPSGAFRDLAGNALAGFSSSTAWNFSTVQSDPNAGTDDFPWDTSTPGVIAVDGAALQGRIEVADDLDLFRVELQAGVTYRLDVTSSGTDGLPDPYLVLYDPDVVQVGEDDDSGGGLDASLTFTPDVSGTYYLGAFDVDSGTGDYTVSAVEVDQIDDDYPDSTDTPGEVSTDGTPLFGRIDYDGDFDVVAVFLEEGVTYRLDARQSGSRPASDPTLWLYDDFAEFIVEDYNGGGGDVDASLTYTAEYTGYHYIGVDDEPGSTGSYVVTAVELSDAIDDLPYENGIVGDLVVDGEVTGGRIDYSDDVDVFAVELRAGETYRFDMSRVAADSLSDPLLQLYDANEELLASDDDSGGGYNASLTFTAPATGTYLLAAFDYSTDTGNYSLRAVTVDDTPPELLDATPAAGDIGVATDADIVLRFSEDVQAGIGDILIFNGNGSLARSIDIADTSQVQIDGGVVTIDPGEDLTPGVGYYVIVDPGVITDSAGNDFAGIDDPEALGFETAALEVNDDFPLDANTPGVVTVNGAAATGVIDYADDGDLFRIEMVRGKTYTIDLARAGSGGLADPYLALYAPDGEFVTFDDDTAGDGNSRIRFTALESGTFFLGVFDYGTGTGAYTLRAAAGADDFLVGAEGPDLLRGLAGNDTLDGAGGIDTLEGGTGNDLLVVDDSRDVVRELSGAGTDTVQSSASFTLPGNVEHLKLVGNAAVNASGNAQANQITGNVAANRLAGQGGADTLAGGDGGDTLEGGLGADLLRGDAGNDTLRGGDGGDRLAGGAGKDQLQGGIGADRFLFDTALSVATNIDTISDFSRAQGDAIQLDDDIFRALAGFTGGSLPAARFQSAPGVDVAQGKDVRVIYNSTTGALYYDPDGNGGTAAVQFALLTGAPALTAADILIVA